MKVNWNCSCCGTGWQEKQTMMLPLIWHIVSESRDHWSQWTSNISVIKLIHCCLAAYMNNGIVAKVGFQDKLVLQYLTWICYRINCEMLPCNCPSIFLLFEITFILLGPIQIRSGWHSSLVDASPVWQESWVLLQGLFSCKGTKQMVWGELKAEGVKLLLEVHITRKWHLMVSKYFLVCVWYVSLAQTFIFLKLGNSYTF